jgi:uncharacterized protein YyaL (SSP411 family)
VGSRGACQGEAGEQANLRLDRLQHVFLVPRRRAHDLLESRDREADEPVVRQYQSRPRAEIFRGRAQVHGYLDDYALLGIAFLNLGDATRETVWRERAARLAAALLSRFFREGILATTIAAADLVILPQDDGDNIMPSGTSATVELLARLQAATGKPDYADVVQRIVSGLASTVRDHPRTMSAPAVKRTAPSITTTSPSRSSSTRTTTSTPTRRASIARLSIDGLTDTRVTYPAAIVIKPKFAPDGLKVYEGTVTIRAIAPKTRSFAASRSLRT